MGDWYRFRLAAICAFLRFSRAASASCGISAFIKTWVFSTWSFVRGRIKKCDRVGRASQVIVVMYAYFDDRAVPFSSGVGERVVRAKEFMGVHPLFLGGRILIWNTGRLFKDWSVRIFCRAIMIGSDRLVNERAGYRRVIVFFVSLVIQVLLYLFDACRYDNDEAVVSINGVGD